MEGGRRDDEAVDEGVSVIGSAMLKFELELDRWCLLDLCSVLYIDNLGNMSSLLTCYRPTP